MSLPSQKLAEIQHMISVRKKQNEFLQQLRNKAKLNWESEAVKVCRQKYEFYLKKGNVKKADIYKRKLDSKYDIIENLKKLVKD